MFRVNLSRPSDELFISNVLTHNPQTRHIFRGVFSVNEFVTKPKTLPAAYVYNTFPRSNTSVGHWICIYISKAFDIEFFCSYGSRPPKRLLTMVRQWSRTISWNKIRFQSYASNVCGLYVIYFVHFKCYGWTMQQIQQHFNKKFFENDKYITRAIKSMITFL
jgi:hypothetical protein